MRADSLDEAAKLELVAHASETASLFLAFMFEGVDHRRMR